MKKKSYIAGYIGDLLPAEFESNFEKAEKECVELGFDPVSPLKLDHNHDRSWTSYMKEDLIELLKCDLIYVQKNWRFSPGAKIEIQTAISVGIDVIFQK